MHNLASIRNCHRGERYDLLPPGSFFLVITYFLLSNDFPVIFQVYMNIHDYANEIIFILGPLDERTCQIVSRMI